MDWDISIQYDTFFKDFPLYFFFFTIPDLKTTLSLDYVGLDCV